MATWHVHELREDRLFRQRVECSVLRDRLGIACSAQEASHISVALLSPTCSTWFQGLFHEMEDEHASHLDITSSAVLFTDEEIQDTWSDFVTYCLSLPAACCPELVLMHCSAGPQATTAPTITTATMTARIVFLSIVMIIRCFVPWLLSLPLLPPPRRCRHEARIIFI